MRLCVICHVVYLALISFNTLAGKCPDPIATQVAILSIEESDDAAEQKIPLLLELIRSYDECTTPKDSVYARILHRLGDLYRTTGNFEKGIAFTQQAVKINQHSSAFTSRSFLTNSFYNLGLYNALLSYYDESNEYFDSCIYVGKNYTPKLHIVLMAYEQKCFNLFSMGKYQEAIDAADNGIFAAKQSQNNDYQGILLQQKAQAQLALGMNEEAETNGKLALETLRSSPEIGKEYLASAFATYARIKAVGADPSAAVKYYSQSISLNKELQNLTQCSRDYMDLGYLYDYTLHDSTMATQCYKHALAAMSSNPDPYQLATLHNNIGVMHWRNRNYQKALTHYQEGLNVLPINFNDQRPQKNPSPSMIRYVTNDYFMVTILENKAETFLDIFKSSSDKTYLHHGLATYKIADKAIDQMRRRQFQETSKLFWREKTRKLYEKAVETCYLLQDAESAFFFFEKSRAVLLNDKLNELGANKNLSEEDARKERDLRAAFFTLQQQLQQLPAESPSRDALKDKWYEAQSSFENHIRTLEEKYPRYFQYKYDTTSYAIGDVRQILSENNQTLLEYFTTDTVVYSLSINADTVSFRKQKFKDFREVTDKYLALCSRPSMRKDEHSEFIRLSHSLYQQLFNDLPVSTRRVVVSFDDYFIPFESLISSRQKENSYLVKDYVFLYAYSGSSLLKKNKQRRLNNSILGVAPISYNTSLNLAPLRGAESSLKRIESYFRKSFSLTNETATKETFLKTFPSYPVVHVYSHAMADYGATEPKLYFHDEPVLLRELQMLPEVNTQLIVLSGCRTGVGKTMKGEGVFSLARGFAAAGIPSTITTLWSVDDQMTYNIMEKFYELLQQGESSDEALQKAKLLFLEEQDGENILPYYWASTVVLGNVMQMENSIFTESFLFRAVLAISLVLSVAAFLLRKRSV